MANLTLQKTVDLSKDDLLGDILQDISAEVSMLIKSVGNDLNPLILLVMEHTTKIQFFVKLDSLRLISSIAHLIDRFHMCVQSALLSAPCRCCMTALLGKAIPL